MIFCPPFPPLTTGEASTCCWYYLPDRPVYQRVEYEGPEHGHQEVSLAPHHSQRHLKNILSIRVAI
jgi:hypothetical protein